MQICPKCNYKNRMGVIFCENCGTSLIGESALSTRSLGEKDEKEEKDAAVAAIINSVGSEIFKDGALLRIEIEGSNDPLLLKPLQEVILGRRDPATGAMPTVDLTPFAGYRMGVSRRHAAIRPGDSNRLDVWDLGSGNGTFLNGLRLSSHRPYRLRDGDEIRLGQMVMKMYFQLPSSTSAAETPPALAKPMVVASPAPAAGTSPLESSKAIPGGEPAKNDGDTGGTQAANPPQGPKTSGVNTPQPEPKLNQS